MEYEAVIGLEVHAQLLTESKIFCSCSTKFGAPPNTQVCPVCLGMPGVLPVLNRKAVECAIRMALATNCQIARFCRFARKNYFYPDLPKGYQISQYEEPISYDGYIDITVNGQTRRVGLIRIHLEEDTGKSIHPEGTGRQETMVNINRCGVPLVEIVTRPDLRSSEEAHQFLWELRRLVRYLEICDGNMEEGSLRCDANISLRPVGSQTLGTKTEVKNMNSFKAVQRALQAEIERQKKILEQGGTIVQETLLWDEGRGTVLPMRGKEEAHDYRYFPEPDLVPLEVDQRWIEEIRQSMPELPLARQERFVRQYGLPPYDAEVLTTGKELAGYYEECVHLHPDPKTVSNWVMGEVLRVLKEKRMEITDFPVSPHYLAELLKLIDEGTISGKIAKTVFEEMANTGKPPGEIVEEKGLVQIADQAELEGVIDRVLEECTAEVERYRAGKTKLFGYFVGQTMKATGGRANPKLVNEILRRKLDAE